MGCSAPWIICRSGKKVILLARDDKAFYIIDAGKNLDYATEEWLERQGISEDILRELKLSYDYIPKTAVKSVAIGGCQAGDGVYLYLHSGKRSEHILELDYEKADMEKFFSGITRCTPPKQKKTAGKKDKNWRTEGRDPELFEKFKIVAPILLGSSVLSNLAYVIIGGRLVYLLCLITIIAPVVLVLMYPQYFTLLPADKGKKSDAWELEWTFFIHLFTLVFLSPPRNWLRDEAVGLVLGVCAVTSVLVALCIKECRKDKWSFFLALIMGGVIGLTSAEHVNEVFAYMEPESCVVMVEDLERSGGKHKSYECTVMLPDGREVELDISRRLYYDLEVGDYVRVEHGVGLLGIEYANVYPIE